MVLEGEPDGWLLAGDETAIPAIRRFAARIPAGVPARIAIEVRGPEHELALDAAVPVEWIHRGSAPAGTALAAFLESLVAEDRPGTAPFVFVAAESSIVKPGRALLERWSVDPAQAVVKGYWKRGEAEYHARTEPRLGAASSAPRATQALSTTAATASISTSWSS